MAHSLGREREKKTCDLYTVNGLAKMIPYSTWYIILPHCLGAWAGLLAESILSPAVLTVILILEVNSS
jgi:hypothetical protein